MRIYECTQHMNVTSQQWRVLLCCPCAHKSGLSGNGKPVRESSARKRELGRIGESQIRWLYSECRWFWSSSGSDLALVRHRFIFLRDHRPKYTHLRAHSEWQWELAISSFFFRSLLRSLYVCVKGDVKWGEFIFHFEFHFLKTSFSVSHSRGNKHLHFKVLLVKINEKQTFLWSLESALEKLRVEINMFYSSWKRHECQGMWKT